MIQLPCSTSAFFVEELAVSALVAAILAEAKTEVKDGAKWSRCAAVTLSFEALICARGLAGSVRRFVGVL